MAQRTNQHKRVLVMDSNEDYESIFGSLLRRQEHFREEQNPSQGNGSEPRLSLSNAEVDQNLVASAIEQEVYSRIPFTSTEWACVWRKPVPLEAYGKEQNWHEAHQVLVKRSSNAPIHKSGYEWTGCTWNTWKSIAIEKSRKVPQSSVRAIIRRHRASILDGEVTWTCQSIIHEITGSNRTIQQGSQA